MLDSLQIAISKAARAGATFDSDLFKEATQALEAEYIAAWKAAADPVDRERYWLSVQVVGRVCDHLAQLMSDGRLARAEIEQVTRSRAA